MEEPCFGMFGQLDSLLDVIGMGDHADMLDDALAWLSIFIAVA